MTRPSVPSASPVRATGETRFHIDYDWWKQSGQDLRLYMLEHLCESHRAQFTSGTSDSETIDWVDPLTGRVTPVDEMTFALLHHCSRQPEYITDRTSLVDAVFRALIAAVNRPMTALELAQRTGRTSEMILRTLSGRTVYKGLRPMLME